MSNLIELVDICKSYRNNAILKNVNMKVEKGKVYGLVGRNGAGKTTIMKIILGLTDYNSGYILFNNQVITPKKDNYFKAKIGFLIDQASCYSDLTVYQNLMLFHSLKNESSKCYSVDEVITLLNLTQYKNVKYTHLSMGNKQRVLIAIALLNKPELLILDEPLNGLDPQGVIEIRKLIKVLAKEYKMTIIISSHVLDELSKVIDIIGIINNGSMLLEENLDNLNTHFSNEMIIIFDENNIDDYIKAKHIIKNLGYVYKESRDYLITITNFDKDSRIDLFKNLVADNIVPLEYKFNNTTLEKYYFDVLEEVVN
ncbi:ABC transporter ATP-binding protein [Macrococcus animalis]|uniref:ABC transporter ATP-binding protein n=1 Tax=Macrococcus animalis TaxID=3395467 RepID=UPI0039BE2182